MSGAALTEAWRTGQARGSAKVQAALAEAWDRWALRSPDRYLDAASAILGLGHAQSASAARAYYVESRLAAGLAADLPAIEPVIFDVEAARTSLSVTGPVTYERQVRNGRSALQAAQVAKAASVRYAKRAVLAGGRDSILSLSKADSEARGWARISDGSPCAFCSMLVSRGPDYGSADSAGFQAHDGCGCLPSPVYGSTPGDGWTPQARYYRDLYDQAQAGAILDDDGLPMSFRRVVEAKNAATTGRVSPLPVSRTTSAARRAAARRITAGDLTAAEGQRIAQAARDAMAGRISRGEYRTLVAAVETGARERLLRAAA